MSDPEPPAGMVLHRAPTGLWKHPAGANCPLNDPRCRREELAHMMRENEKARGVQRSEP